jgi:protein TonB
MSSMTMSSAYGADLGQPGLKQRCAKLAPLAGIVVLHGVLFYLLQTGTLHQMVRALPQVVNVTFVAAEPPPPPPKPSSPPKTVALAPAPTFVPPLPLLSTPQIEPTITLPPAAPARAVEARVATSSTAAVTPSAAPSAPKTVTGVEYLRAPQPVYPNISRRLGETGVVMLRVLIGEKGLPEQVSVHKSSGSSNLDEAGRQAALRALYKPYLEDGKPVSVYVLVPINFQMG